MGRVRLFGGASAAGRRQLGRRRVLHESGRFRADILADRVRSPGH